jgi:hypothetical protein
VGKYDEFISPDLAQEFGSPEAKNAFEFLISMAFSYTKISQGSRDRLTGQDEIVQVLVGSAAAAGFEPALELLDQTGTLDLIRNLRVKKEPEVPECMRNWGGESDGPIGRYD